MPTVTCSDTHLFIYCPHCNHTQTALDNSQYQQRTITDTYNYSTTATYNLCSTDQFSHNYSRLGWVTYQCTIENCSSNTVYRPNIIPVTESTTSNHLILRNTQKYNTTTNCSGSPKPTVLSARCSALCCHLVNAINKCISSAM